MPKSTRYFEFTVYRRQELSLSVRQRGQDPIGGRPTVGAVLIRKTRPAASSLNYRRTEQTALAHLSCDHPRTWIKRFLAQRVISGDARPKRPQGRRNPGSFPTRSDAASRVFLLRSGLKHLSKARRALYPFNFSQPAGTRGTLLLRGAVPCT